jgi:hypothetical protein
LRFLGFLAACTAVALTACSSGGSTAVPTSQQGLASTLRSTTISSVGRNTSEHTDCESDTGSRHEHSAARSGQERDGRDDGGDNGHKDGSCCPSGTGTGSGSGGSTTTRDQDRRTDDAPSPCPSAAPTPAPLTVAPATLAIDCNANQYATLTVAGTPAGLTATSADSQQATVGAPTIVNGNTTFVVTGLGTLPTTIALTDTAGVSASVPVSLVNCPWRR